MRCRRESDRRKLARERQSLIVAPDVGIEVHLLHLAHEVAGRRVEVLAFPLVVVHPDHVAVGAGELRVDVEQRLHVVVAGGDLARLL